MYRFAKIISRVFSPLTLLPLLLWLAISRSSLSPQLAGQVSLILFGFGVFVPVVFLVYLKITGRVSDWGIPIRSQRHLMNLVTLACLGVSWWLLHFIGAAQIALLCRVLFSGGLLFALITWWWKISAHMVAVTLTGMLIAHWFGVDWWWSLPVIIVVGWSRIYLKKHTPAQVTGGFILAWGIFLWSVLKGI